MEDSYTSEHKYNFSVNVDDENSPWTKIVKLVGGSKTVLDFGCATGYLSEVLSNHGCRVIGVDSDEEAIAKAAKFCEQTIKMDIDELNLEEFLGDRKVDAAIFGDVLEHLKNPKRVLQITREFLAEDGFVIASVPNIAHGSIRLQLLAGNFDYTETGLLDSSHLRFFTKNSLIRLFEESGYIVVSVEHVIKPIEHKDFIGLPSGIVEPLLSLMQQDSSVNVFQYVIKARPTEEKGSLLAKDELLLDQRIRFEERILNLEKQIKEKEQVIKELEQFSEKVKKTPSYWIYRIFIKPFFKR